MLQNLPCIQSQVGYFCPSAMGHFQLWRSWSCVMMYCRRGKTYHKNCVLVRWLETQISARIIQNLPVHLHLHIMSGHKERPPSDLSLGFVFYILLVHLLGSQFSFKVENILLFASTERNLCISVCQVHILQSLRSDRDWCTTIILKTTQKAENSSPKFRFQIYQWSNGEK